jgi:hypothetical protein
MKITKSQLEKIILEEIAAVEKERHPFGDIHHEYKLIREFVLKLLTKYGETYVIEALRTVLEELEDGILANDLNERQTIEESDESWPTKRHPDFERSKMKNLKNHGAPIRDKEAMDLQKTWESEIMNHLQNQFNAGYPLEKSSELPVILKALDNVRIKLKDAHRGSMRENKNNETVDPFMISYIEIAKKMLVKGKEEQKIDPQLANELLSMMTGIEGTSGMEKPE